MANEMGCSLSFSDFPEDIQVCILSFLSPVEVANFACTSKRFVSLCRNDTKLWYTMCDRRWGSKTQINKWGCGKITYKLLYKTLNQYENLVGFWRRCGGSGDTSSSFLSSPPSPPLIFFDWGPSFLTGSWVVNSSQNGACNIPKSSPFLFMGISSDGDVLNYVDLNGHSEVLGDFVNFSQLGVLEKDLVSVNVNFIESDYLLVEENQNYGYKNGVLRRSSSWKNFSGGEESEDNVTGGSPGSLPDRLVSEMYIHFANRTSPGADRRRQRRKEKERQGRKKWETEHFIKFC